MKMKDIRALSKKDIELKIQDTRNELLKLVFKLANQKLDNNQEIKKKKKLIARLKTTLNQKG